MVPADIAEEEAERTAGGGDGDDGGAGAVTVTDGIHGEVEPKGAGARRRKSGWSEQLSIGDTHLAVWPATAPKDVKAAWRSVQARGQEGSGYQ